MLRPATPLTVLLFLAFVLLLISILSTPIIKGIPLASFSGYNFGVFGYCQGDKCSKIEIGYNTGDLYDTDQNGTFDIPTNTRTTLSSILIVHPIAAFFTLVMLILAGTAHAHSPSHSPRFLLGVFILSILTLLLSLLSFLIDVLLFVPHMAWGSYLVLAATILIAASGLISCAMRRTLVSRKARAKRIAENAEMNGENFYARQATEPIAPPPSLPAPIVNGGPGADKLPSFATFDLANMEKERTSDERIPLTARTPSERSPNGAPAGLHGGPQDQYGGPPQMAGALGGMSNGRLNGPPQRDQYGNIIPPQAAYGQPGIRRDPSQDRMRGGYGDGGFRGRGGPPGGYRGRGGPGYGRGGSGYGRGGFNPNMRGGYGPPGPGRGGPNGMMGPMAGGIMMRGGRGQPPGYSRGNEQMYRGESPAGYGPEGRRPGPGPNGGPGHGNDGYGAYGVDGRSSLPRAESPPPLSQMNGAGAVGQAIEMDATTGSSSTAPRGYENQFGGVRDSDSDVAGMVGLQQQRQDTVVSDVSRYSNDVYVPPRQQWNDGQSSSPKQTSRTQGAMSPHSPIHRRTSSSGDHYYEDVDPRFAEPIQPSHELQTIPQASQVPIALVPGYSQNGLPPHNPQYLHPSSSNPTLNTHLEPRTSYEDIQGEGSRSPAESERSNFTSVSQRGVNPRWNPGMGPGGFGPPQGNGMNIRRPVPPPAQRNEILLDSNPDFELPGATARPGRAGSKDVIGRRPLPATGGMVPRSAYEGSAL